MKPNFIPRMLSHTASLLMLWMPCAGTLAQSPAPLAVVSVELREVDLTYPADAVVEAIKQATVAAQVQGRIIEVRADAGDRVRAGQVLMRIDERETGQALAVTQAQLANAKANYERTRNLFAQKFVSQAALDKAESDYKAAAASTGQAGAVASFTTITAPINGIVAQRHAELGEMASPGKPLITIFEPKGLRVIASIPQYKLADIRQKPQARVEFPEIGKWLDAARVEILPTADARTHAVSARIYLPEAVESIGGIVPGMFARAHFIVGKAKKLLVPATAVLRRSEVTAVYVIDEKNLPHLRQVRLGEAVSAGVQPPSLEVLAGLTAGETVALDPVKAGIQLKQAIKK